MYYTEHLRAFMRFRATTLRLERRAGRLRVGRDGRGLFVRGSWLLEWLDACELPRKKRATRKDAA